MSSALSPRAWSVFLLVVAADVLDLLSTTVANVAAPTIVRDLGVSWSPAPWLGANPAQAGSAGGVSPPWPSPRHAR
ncbi:hypothetical protein ABZ860_32635 [Microbispora sp. NPDC046973]|uniref:hypothetical protein n=1 Tax=Microbispora sp. NPDC046973 TaxID=3155022 RepID=UPI003401F2DC